MVDKTKKAPLPEQPKDNVSSTQKGSQPVERSADPTFVRGTIDPTTKKER